MKTQYLAIDLKSFYASVECVERGLDPLTARLVVADESRTEKTICLAVSPALKKFGIPGRARLFEVVRKVEAVNRERRRQARNGGSRVELVDYMVARPRMALYIKYSARIYEIYLKYVAPGDIYAYSIDEVFIDATHYLEYYKCTAVELAGKIIGEILVATGITATAGVGTNLYLAKVAMDVEAKKMEPDEKGVRIAELDERSYREKLWDHRPLTDFWRVGKATARKLEERAMFTMGDVALCSERNEELLYKMFGVNAELLIDHAWGWEPCTLAEIKKYRPTEKSLSSGQVLARPYDFGETRTVVREMVDALVLELVEKRLVTDQIVVDVGYDVGSGGLGDVEVKLNRYGQKVPKPAHGSVNLSGYTSSAREIAGAAMGLFERIMRPEFFARRLNVTANHILREEDMPEEVGKQMDLFAPEVDDKEERERERRGQEAILAIKRRYGRNAILTGTNFEKGATMRERNGQIGGHRA